MQHQRQACLVAWIGLWFLQATAWGQAEKETAPILKLQAKHVLKFEDRPASLSFSRDGSRFACSVDRSARVWDTRTWKQISGFTDDRDYVGPVVLSPDGRTVAFTKGTHEEIHLLEVASGKVVRTLRGHTHSMLGPRFSPDSKLLCSATCLGIQIWDLETGKDLERFPVKKKASHWLEEERRLAFSPDGRTLAAATGDGTVHLLDVGKGKPARPRLPAETDGKFPSALAFSPDGRLLAVGVGSTNRVTVWDWSNGRPRWRLQWPDPSDDDLIQRLAIRGNHPQVKQRPGAFSLAFGVDGRTLMVSCNDCFLRVWEVASGTLRFRVETDPIFLAASPAGDLIATAVFARQTRQVDLMDSRPKMPPARGAKLSNSEKMWADLGEPDAALAYGRIRELVSVPKDALVLLGKHLPYAEPLSGSALELLIQQLDDDRFEVRDRARQRLEVQGEAAKPALSVALSRKLSPEARKMIQELLDRLAGPYSSEQLRFIRAVEVLEKIGAPESRKLLERMATGAPEHLLTREAKAALRRLSTGSHSSP